MANVLVEESSLINIANAIREKNGSTDSYKPSEMPQAITDIQSGSGDSELEKYINSYKQAMTLSYYGSKTTESISVILPTNITTMSQMFRQCNNTPSMSVIGGNVVTSMYRCFYYCTSVTEITLDVDTSQCTNFETAFENNQKLTSIIGTLDFSSATNVTSCFGSCFRLVDIDFKENSLSLSMAIPSRYLSEKSKQSVAYGLATVSTAQTLTLHSGLVLNDELKAAIQGKGWTLVQ